MGELGTYRCLQKLLKRPRRTAILGKGDKLNREDAKIAKKSCPTFAFFASWRLVLLIPAVNTEVGRVIRDGLCIGLDKTGQTVCFPHC